MSALALRVVLYGLFIGLIVGTSYHLGDSRNAARHFEDGRVQGTQIANAAHQGQIDQMNRDARTRLDARADENRTLQAKLDAEAVQRKADHETASQSLDALAVRNRDLARQLGGLRDPGRSTTTASGGSGRPAGETSSSATRQPQDVPAQADGLLSGRATDFLLGYARSADGDARAAAECIAFVRSEGY